MNDDFDKRKPGRGGKSAGGGASRGKFTGGEGRRPSGTRKPAEAGAQGRDGGRPPRRERPEGEAGFRKKPESERTPRRLDRDGQAARRPREDGDRPSAPRAERPFRARDDRRTGERDGEKRPFKPRGEKPFGERPPRRPREEGERSFAPRGGRPARAYDGEKRDFKPRGEKSFGDRKPYGDRPPRRDRPDGERPDFKKREYPVRDGQPRDAAKREYPKRDSAERSFTKRDSGGAATGRPAFRKSDDARRDFKPRDAAPRAFGKKAPYKKSAPERVSDDAPQTAAALPATDRPERIAKVLARAGVCSRREAEDLIAEGRVAVNGRVLKSAALNVGPGDKIAVDGKPVAGRERTRLWMYHKPAGLVTTAHDPEGRPTVFDALPSNLPRVVSIGRLDINTEGLLLLTNDGGLARVLAHPETAWLRRYRVRVFGNPEQTALDKLRDGITIDGVHYGPIIAKVDREQGSNSWLTMDLREGKNREIKRVLEELGFQVSRLIRISFGPFQLSDLGEGAVEEVCTRVLADQLGEELAAQANVDFEAPIVHADHISEKKGRQVRALPQSRMEEEEKARRTEIGTTQDRKGRSVRVERIVATEKPAVELRRKTKREMAPQADDVPRRAASRDGDRRFDRPRDDRPRATEKREFKPRGDKPFGDKKFGDRPPRGDKPFGERKPYAPRGDKPFGDKKFGDRPPRGDKPFGERKPYAPRGSKPSGDKPRGRSDGSPRGRDGGGRPPRNRDR